jgi:hypothetical protein
VTEKTELKEETHVPGIRGRQQRTFPNLRLARNDLLGVEGVDGSRNASQRSGQHALSSGQVLGCVTRDSRPEKQEKGRMKILQRSTGRREHETLGSRQLTCSHDTASFLSFSRHSSDATSSDFSKPTAAASAGRRWLFGCTMWVSGASITGVPRALCNSTGRRRTGVLAGAISATGWPPIADAQRLLTLPTLGWELYLVTFHYKQNRQRPWFARRFMIEGPSTALPLDGCESF